jgi:hypothetical protein
MVSAVTALSYVNRIGLIVHSLHRMFTVLYIQVSFNLSFCRAREIEVLIRNE